MFPKENGKYIFPIADGRIKPLDKTLRTSTLIRDRPIQGEGHVDFLGESEGSLSPLHDSFPDAGEAINDFLVQVRKLHLPPSRWTKSPTLLAERRIIPYSTEIHWRLQNYTQIWMLSKRKASMIIGISMGLETCQILGQVSLNLFFWKNNLQTDICGPVRGWQESS